MSRDIKKARAVFISEEIASALQPENEDEYHHGGPIYYTIFSAIDTLYDYGYITFHETIDCFELKSYLDSLVPIDDVDDVPAQIKKIFSSSNSIFEVNI